MLNPKTSGVINGKHNILEYPCKEINRTSPYFMKLNREKYQETNDYLFETINTLHQQDVDYSDRNFPIKHLDELPDGTITVEEASKRKLKYKFQINDNRYWQYHRNNGITKLGILNAKPADGEEDVLYMIRTIEGQIQVADMINQAYLRELFPDTYIINGIQFMPFQPSLDVEIQRILNAIGLAVFPSCLCILLPVFIYNLVLEKETKLLETMKINGMKMSYYWLVNFLFNLAIYLFTVAVYWFCAAFVFGMNFFTDTDWRLLALVFFGWGICSISFAFFCSVFIDNSATANIIGYTMSIWSCTIACTMDITIWSNPQRMDWFAYFIPSFPYIRMFYHMGMACSYSACYKSISKINEETWHCLIAIYVLAVVYLVLAIYLH